MRNIEHLKTPVCPRCKGDFTAITTLDDDALCGCCKSCGACFALIVDDNGLQLKSIKWPADPVWK